MKPWIRTHSGRELDLLNLKPEDIDIDDIAHALAQCNRFAGHVCKPISVAQHSVYVSRLCDRTGFELAGLLHDASEAYLGDMTKWLKQDPSMARYREAEDHVQRMIHFRFDVFESPLMTEQIDRADKLMVRYEGWQGFGDDFKIDHPDYPPLCISERQLLKEMHWQFWDWTYARSAFLVRFKLLTDPQLQAPEGSGYKPVQGTHPAGQAGSLPGIAATPTESPSDPV